MLNNIPNTEHSHFYLSRIFLICSICRRFAICKNSQNLGENASKTLAFIDLIEEDFLIIMNFLFFTKHQLSQRITAEKIVELILLFTSLPPIVE